MPDTQQPCLGRTVSHIVSGSLYQMPRAPPALPLPPLVERTAIGITGRMLTCRWRAVWLYHRFCLSFREVEDLLAERGVTVS